MWLAAKFRHTCLWIGCGKSQSSLKLSDFLLLFSMHVYNVKTPQPIFKHITNNVIKKIRKLQYSIFVIFEF